MTLPEIWEPRPVPPIAPENGRYWAAAADERLLVRECSDCGLVYHYPSALCPDCFGDAEWHETSGAGTVYSFTLLRNHESWPDSDLPIPFAYVELEEGPRMITNVFGCPPEGLEIGLDVTVRFVPTESDSVAVPVFVPQE